MARSIFTCTRISYKIRVLIAFCLGPLLFWSPTRIRRSLEERGFHFLPSITSIRDFCRKFRTTEYIEDRPRSIRPKSINENHLQFLHQLILGDREITNKELRKRLAATFHLHVGKETMRGAIGKLGWVKKKTRYCQLIRDANKAKRLVFAHLCMVRQDDFNDVIFSDESSIQLVKNGRLRFRRADELSVTSKVGKPKHPYKVHVWGGISSKGATDVCIFTGMLNAAGLEKIFKLVLFPFIKKKFPEGHRFVQDNDPKHTSKRIKELMKSNGVHHWRTPPESPDLNPIEMVWADLKLFLTKQKPSNRDQLVDGIRDYWMTLTPQKCRRFINHIKKVVPLVVLHSGQATGH